MEIQKYIEEKKKLYESIIEFISSECKHECLNDEISNDIFNKDYFANSKEKIRLFLKLISIISENHHRSTNFLDKIEHIIINYSSEIKQTFTNLEIYEIFQNNKIILLFLFEQKIINVDESILVLINKKSDIKNDEKNDKEEEEEEEEEEEDFDDDNKRIDKYFNYQIYFYPEIKSFIDEKQTKSIESELFELGLNEPDIFESLRKKGENDSYTCDLIRQDSIKEFITYVNKTNLSLQHTRIKSSIFETNSYLISKNPTLIEYAAFYGSIQIFQYLQMNNVELNPILWEYAIHGNNASIINLLEENHVYPPTHNYESCLKESIKCHHNDIAKYIIDNLMDEKSILNNINFDFNYNLYFYSFEYMNYNFFPENQESKCTFHYLCKFGYTELVKLYLQYGNIDINSRVVLHHLKF